VSIRPLFDSDESTDLDDDDTGASDWCALQEALYKCIDTIQYNTIQYNT